MKASPTRNASTSGRASCATSRWREDAALGDHEAPGRDARQKAEGRLQRHAEIPQVAVVDADAAASCSASARSSSRGVVHLDEHVQPVVARGAAPAPPSARRSSAATISRIASAPSARDSATWYSSTMNSLRSAGSEQAAARGDQVVRAPLEERAVGEHRQAGRAGPLVARRDGRRIEIRAQHALARAGLLDLGDHRRLAGRDLRAERAARSRAAAASPRGARHRRRRTAARLARR